MYTDNSSYAAADATATGLITVEPSLTYTGRRCDRASSSRVAAISATQWAAARLSASNTCFYISDSSTAGTKYGQTAPGTACAVPTMALAAAASWT